MAIDEKIEKKTTCPLDCPDSCGMIATVEDGKVVNLRGDFDHPYTGGVVCRKMRSYHQRLYGKNRILTPMQRVGKKGQADFTQISWSEAYTILAEKITGIIDAYGGEAILPFVYAGNMGAINRYAGYPLFHKLGASRQLETICSAAASEGWKSQCGDIPGCSPHTAEDGELIIIWGSNTKVTNMHFWPQVVAARKKGARLLVIDPYRNITAQAADLHLQVEPGGDSALALAVLKELLEKDSLDREFIEKYCTGFASLEHYLVKTPWTELVEKSGIAKESIELFADLLRKHSRTFLRLGIGMTRNGQAGMAIRSITSLAAALGLFDGGKGRGVLLTTGAFRGKKEKLTWPSLAQKESRTFNMVQLGNCLRRADPPVKMLFVYNANPVSVCPDTSLVRHELQREDLFTVVHEQVMTPTARYADLLLPATTFLENKDVYTSYGHFYLSVADPVIAPCGEAKSNFDFFQGLAKKLGYDDPAFQQSIEHRIADYLEDMEGLPEDFSFEQYDSGTAVLSTRLNTEEPFYTGSNRFKFTCDDDPAIPRIPCLIEAGEFEDADYLARYPFKLITPPHMDLLNSTFGERYQDTLGEVLIHPQDASANAIEDGVVVTITNSRGWTRRIARLSDATRRGLLVAEGLFWQTGEHPTSINDLTSQKLTDMGGGGTFHESRVALGVS